MANVKAVKSIYTGSDITALGEVAAADNVQLPGSLGVDSLTASRAMVTDASKVLVSSAATAAEVAHLSGVTGAIQTQINNITAGAVPLTALGGTIYGAVAGTPTELAGNTAAVKKFLSQTGTGAVSAAPAWGALPAALPHVIGVEWAQATDTWKYLDQEGNQLFISQADLDRHPVWGGMRRVNLSAAGAINAAIGDQGFSLTGSNGRVMVEVPKFYTKTNSPSANVYQWFISDVPLPGYYLHPAFKQTNGGAVTRTGNMYIGAYAADLDYDGAVKLNSRTGTQPFTGGQIWSIPFGSGDNEPVIGDDVSTTEANMFVVDYVVTGGSWAGNDAAGILYVRKPGDDTNSTANPENIVNNTQANTMAATTGTATALSLTLAQARGYAQAVGTGWNVVNYWEWSALRLLYLIEYKGANAQTTIGQGIVNKAGGTGFAGELNGAASIDANLAANGTGAGTGTDGLVPIAYRGIENFWGNVWQWIEGWNAVDGTDAANDVKYRLLKADGSSTYADALATYDELAVTHTGLPDGWQSNLHFNAGFSLLFLPSALAGGSTSHLFDYFWEHNTGQTNALLAGCGWDYGSSAGPGCSNSNSVAGGSYHHTGARLSFLK